MLKIRGYISHRFVDLFSSRPREDVESINYLLAQLSKLPRQLDEQKLKELISRPNFFLLVARVPNNNIVCMASLVIYETLMKKVGVIEDVVVDQDHRGKGLGKYLVKTLIKTARRLNVDYVDLTSHPDRVEANGLYQKLGFKRHDTNCYRLDL